MRMEFENSRESMSHENKTCCCASRPNSPEHEGKQIYNAKIKSDKPVTNGMIYLSGGEFLMGTDSNEGFPKDGEGPVRNVKVNPFSRFTFRFRYFL